MKSLTIFVVLLFVGSSMGCYKVFGNLCGRMDADMDLNLVMSTVISKHHSRKLIILGHVHID